MVAPSHPLRAPRRPRPSAARSTSLAVAIGMAVVLSSCASGLTTAPTPTNADTSPGARASGGSCPGGTPIEVVAGENFWGSIATQLGGRYAHVTSVISSPQTDPHDYEPTPDDGRAVATADELIVNGLGYDPWLTKLADANPSVHRTTLDVGQNLGLADGDNPHRWYFPADVDRVIDQITADYKRIDPGDAPCFDQLKSDYQTTDLQRYHRLIQEIGQRQAGTPIGASESIAVGLARATALNLVTPPSYLDAISEGTDPTSQDKTTVDAQIDSRQIKVFVFNTQNSTPDVQSLVNRAKAAGIPVIGVTETMVPADGTFQDWQSDQLQRLADALAGQGGDP
jgi:zinc/manganese transport system substrate-binding protein